MSEANEPLGLVFIIPPDYPLLERKAEVEALIKAAGVRVIAALRLSAAGLKREALLARGQALRELGNRYNLAVMIDDHPSLAKELGLAGVHLNAPDAKTLRDARKLMQQNDIIGVHAGASRHDGMVLAEIGADYVTFGPLKDLGLDQEVAPTELFSWWAEMIEVPLVAEGGLDGETLAEVAPFVDYVAFGDEVFGAPNPIEALNAQLSILQKLAL